MFKNISHIFLMYCYKKEWVKKKVGKKIFPWKRNLTLLGNYTNSQLVYNEADIVSCHKTVSFITGQQTGRGHCVGSQCRRAEAIIGPPCSKLNRPVA